MTMNDDLTHLLDSVRGMTASQATAYAREFNIRDVKQLKSSASPTEVESVGANTKLVLFVDEATERVTSAQFG